MPAAGKADMKTQPIIKNENMKAIYRAVCRNRAVSRARLARDLGLSKPTVSLLVDELIREEVAYYKEIYNEGGLQAVIDAL